MNEWNNWQNDFQNAMANAEQARQQKRIADLKEKEYLAYLKANDFKAYLEEMEEIKRRKNREAKASAILGIVAGVLLIGLLIVWWLVVGY